MRCPLASVRQRKSREDGACLLEHKDNTARKGRKKKMVPANFSEAEQEDGTHPPSSLAPLPQTNTLKLANMSLSHKVWALFKGLLLC